jgi:soluble cytochrome b562
MTSFPPVSATALESVLNSRINQAIAITPPTDQPRIEVLETIRRIERYPERVAKFSDCLIDHIVTLSKELSDAKRTIARLDEQTPQKREPRASASPEYEECLRLLQASRDHLSGSLEKLVAQNANLRRIRREEKAILVRQNEIIAQLRGREDPELTGLRGGFERLSEKLESLTHGARQSRRHRI